MIVGLKAKQPGRIKRILDGLAALPTRLGGNETNKIGDAVRQGIADNFTSESAGGQRWVPLAASTVAQRRRLGFAGAHPILQRTRELKASFTSRGHGSHVQTVERAGGKTIITIGSSDERSPWLQGGTATIPPRPIAVLGERQLDRVQETVVHVLEQGAHRIK